jgi:hypothetical protein
MHAGQYQEAPGPVPYDVTDLVWKGALGIRGPDLDASP